MKACPFCAEDIQDAAIVCKHCRRDLPTRRSVPTPAPERDQRRLPVVLALAGFVAVLAILGFIVLMVISKAPSASSGSAPENDPEKVAELIAFVEKAKTSGLIHSLNVDSHKVQVNRFAWEYFDADAKRGFAISMAAYCALNESSGPHLRYVDVIDSQSGKTIATYSPSGFHVN